MVTYAAPTGLDVSACIVKITGGTTSQTLADMAKSVEDNATVIADVSGDASDAKSQSAQAVQNSNSAMTDASSAKTLSQSAQDTASSALSDTQDLKNTVNGLIPKTAIGSANGVVGTDAGNGASIPNASTGEGYITFKPAQAGKSCKIWFQALNSTGVVISSPTLNHDFVIPNWGISGDYYEAKNTTYLEMIADVIQPCHGTSDLGAVDSPWNNGFFKTAPQVTSDINEKTVAGSLGDSNYLDGQKLATALFSLDSCLYQLNGAIANKGADNARLHAGFIAQQVEAAITKSGLDPANFALWTKTPLLDVTKTLSDKTDENGNPIYIITRKPKLDENGAQVYGQMLRYEELLCILFEAAKTKILSQGEAITALTERVAALEAKATV